MSAKMVPTYEDRLLAICTRIGDIAKMNASSTYSFSEWIKLMADGRHPVELTIMEFLTLLDRWKEWQARLFEEQKKTSNQKPETSNPNTENPKS